MSKVTATETNAGDFTDRGEFGGKSAHSRYCDVHNICYVHRCLQTVLLYSLMSMTYCNSACELAYGCENSFSKVDAYV